MRVIGLLFFYFWITVWHQQNKSIHCSTNLNPKQTGLMATKASSKLRTEPFKDALLFGHDPEVEEFDVERATGFSTPRIHNCAEELRCSVSSFKMSTFGFHQICQDFHQGNASLRTTMPILTRLLGLCIWNSRKILLVNVTWNQKLELNCESRTGLTPFYSHVCFFCLFFLMTWQLPLW